jgi:signal peptidase II
MKQNKTLIITFTLVVILDQITKYIFSKQIIDLGLIILRPVTNTGMSFGLFQGNNLIFIIISIIFITFLIRFREEFKENQILLIMILAGATGNLIDRIIRGHVMDFIDFRFFPVFNVADSLIFLGVAGIIISEIRQMTREKKKIQKKESGKNKTKQKQKKN